MKKYLYLAFIFLSATYIQAQSYTFSPSNKYVETLDINCGYTDFQVDIVNHKSTKLSMTWYLDTNTFLKAWDYSLCDFGNCFVGIPSGHQMDSISIGSSGFLKLNFSPQGIAGKGEVRMIIYETSNPSVKDTILFSFNVAKLAGIKEIANAPFCIYPNPANTSVNLTFDPNKIAQIYIYSLEGKEAMKLQPNMSGIIDVSTLAAGTYIVSIIDKQNHSYRNTLIKNEK